LHRAGSDDDLAQRLQAMLEAHHGRHEFPGVVLALRRPRGTELTLTAGTQRADAAEPGVDADVPWIIGSATKSFVAVTVLQLVQEGRLALDQSVEAWLPTIPWARSITVRHLLQHASGLAEYIDLPEVQREARRAWTADELIDAAVARGCGAGQGKRHAYSNTNYLALGCIVQQVAGRVWYEEVRARVLAPLGMHRTGYAGAGDALAIGPGHGEVQGAFVDLSHRWHASLGGAAGGMYSTAGDLVKFAAALATGALLDARSQAQMRTFLPAEADEGVQQEYGLGLQRFTLDGTVMYGHLGSGSAHSCCFGFALDSGVSVAVLTNVENPAPAAFLAMAALREAAAGAVPAAIEPLPAPLPEPGADPIPRGLHGKLQVLGGGTFGRPAATETYGTDRSIDSLTGTRRRDEPIGAVIAELSYTFECVDTQLFVGTSELATADAQAALEVGVRQLLADGTLLTAAYAPAIRGPLGQVWDDPYATGAPRRRVDVTAQGFRFGTEHTLGLPLSFDYQFGRQTVDQERSGAATRLPAEAVRLLHRDSDLQRLRLGATLALSDVVTLEPSFEYATADAKGAANSYDGFGGGLELTYANHGIELTLGADFASTRFATRHPVFDVTRADGTLQASFGLTITAPFGWQQTSIEWLVRYRRNASNIDFYDSDETIVGFGITYEF
jgi:D-alanyl-D-alanine carboxypeptidase